MIIAHRIQLDPTIKQRKYFASACGTARMVWNWGLAEWNRQYKSGTKPNGFTLKKQFNAIKYDLFPWLKSVHRDAHSQPFFDLQDAFVRFFKRQSSHPTFKARGKCRDSFAVSNYTFRLDGQRVRLPVIGWVQMRESLRFTGRIIGARVSRTADRWFIAIQVEIPDPVPAKKPESVVGVDLGLKVLASVSDGTAFENPKPLKSCLKKLARTNRKLARSQKGSNRRVKVVSRLQRIYARASNIRSDALHKLTTQLCQQHTQVAIEDLNVKGMMANRKLARSVADVGFHELSRQFHYKSQIYGCEIVVVNRWFSSSKLCSNCGHKKGDLKLSDRIYRCEKCGFMADRDLNAALNLRTAGLAETYARGQDGTMSDTASDITSLVEARTKHCP